MVQGCISNQNCMKDEEDERGREKEGVEMKETGLEKVQMWYFEMQDWEENENGRKSE